MKINYKKIFNQLIEDYPHDIYKFERVYNDMQNELKKVKECWFEQVHYSIPYQDILESDVWSVEEKVRLLRLFGYNKHEYSIELRDFRDNTTHEFLANEYLIRKNNLSGYEALIKTYNEIELRDIALLAGASKLEKFRNLFAVVINVCQDKDKSKYLRIILENLPEEYFNELLKPYYERYRLLDIENKSIIPYIIKSNDIELIKEYIQFIDVNMYLIEAVETNSIEIVDLFLRKGADVNYLTDEVILSRLTPLKVAIRNNNYEMVNYLISKGAKIEPDTEIIDYVDRIENSKLNIIGGCGNLDIITNNNVKMISNKLVNDEVNLIKYERESSPLEFATKLSEDNYKENNRCYNLFDIYFKGKTFYRDNKVKFDIWNKTPDIIERTKIVDLLFDKVKDKSNINYNDLIIFSLISGEAKLLKKYYKYALDYDYNFDFDKLFTVFFSLKIFHNRDYYDSFFDFIKEYDKENDLFIKFMNYYIKNEVYNFGLYRFSVNDFNKKLLDRIDNKEKRKKICLVPYCKDKESLKYLLSIGFDINQIDNKGRNILYYLLCNNKDDDLTEQEMELFEFLVENVDLSKKDFDNRTVLYYAMQNFNTKDEFIYAHQSKVLTRTRKESAVAKLISKMTKEDVCNDDIKTVLERRTEYCSGFGEKIHLEYVYQHHRELFDALIDKGFILSDKILKSIFDNLYPETERGKKRLDDIVLSKTLDFLYQRLDLNTEIQKLSIETEYQSIMSYLNLNNVSFDNFLVRLRKFNNEVSSLKDFYLNNIQKRFDPKKYLEYAKENFDTVYENLDDYTLKIIIKALQCFGTEGLDTILSVADSFNINHCIFDTSIDYNYWNYYAMISDIVDYDEEGIPIYGNEHFGAYYVRKNWQDKIVLDGGLMHYAILTDNLSMVKLLQERGALFKLVHNDVDYTWNYVNSNTMLNYMESFLGKRDYKDFDDEEKDYYLKLISKDEKKD